MTYLANLDSFNFKSELETSDSTLDWLYILLPFYLLRTLVRSLMKRDVFNKPVQLDTKEFAIRVHSTER